MQSLAMEIAFLPLLFVIYAWARLRGRENLLARISIVVVWLICVVITAFS